jgi:hypothetical protein
LAAAASKPVIEFGIQSSAADSNSRRIIPESIISKPDDRVFGNLMNTNLIGWNGQLVSTNYGNDPVFVRVDHQLVSVTFRRYPERPTPFPNTNIIRLRYDDIRRCDAPTPIPSLSSASITSNTSNTSNRITTTNNNPLNNNPVTAMSPITAAPSNATPTSIVHQTAAATASTIAAPAATATPTDRTNLEMLLCLWLQVSPLIVVPDAIETGIRECFAFIG